MPNIWDKFIKQLFWLIGVNLFSTLWWKENIDAWRHQEYTGCTLAVGLIVKNPVIKNKCNKKLQEEESRKP